MCRVSRSTGVGLSALSLLVVGFTFIVGTASAAGTLPSTINDVVSPSGLVTDAGCPAGLNPSTPTFSSLSAAVAAATSGWTIYVCAGDYDLSTYGADENVVINEPLTIDGYNWDVAPAPSDTPASYDPTTQSVFENGSGFLVESSDVTISGLTFYKNNFNDPGEPDCGGTACASAIHVQSFVSGVGDQGESDVTIRDNFFDNDGGSYQDGVVHFGLGADGSAWDIGVLDVNDVVEDNVFTYVPGYENNAVQMSDTIGALVTGNTVNYPANNSGGQDDSALTALWFPGFNQELTVSDNTLNGGGIDSDSGASPDTGDPKSGIKVIDEDMSDAYGNGCSGQTITDNVVSGFVYGISVIGNDVNVSGLCAPGPTDFTVSGNTISDTRLYGIYVSADATYGTISENVASDTDSEGYAGISPNYTTGEYDYYDASGNSTSNDWLDDSGNGSSYPKSVDEGSTTTTTTLASPPPSNSPPTSSPTTTTTTTTTTTFPPVMTKPSITLLAATFGLGDRVRATVKCAGANCSGVLEVTRVVDGKVVALGKVGYNLAKGTERVISIQLNATGLALLRSNVDHLFICELTATSAGGVKHKNISI